MKYWKNGWFQGEDSEGALAISDERWQELLGLEFKDNKRIATGADGYPILVEMVITEEQIRAERDALIQEVIWRKDRYYDEVELGITPTEPITPILEYIQALRDVPQQEGFPTEVVWPTQP